MHRSRILLVALASLLVAGGLGVAWARVQPLQPGNDDRDFIDAVVERNHAGIDMGLRVAESENAAIRVFGEQMVHDLYEMNQQLMAVAHDKGIEASSAAGLASRVKTGLAGILPGATFDRTYMSSQLEGRKAVLALLQAEAQQRDDMRLQVLATQSLPVVRKQLAAIERLQNDTRQP